MKKFLKDNLVLLVAFGTIMFLGIGVLLLLRGGTDSPESSITTTTVVGPTLAPNTSAQIFDDSPTWVACRTEMVPFFRQVVGFEYGFFNATPELQQDELIAQLEPFVTDELLGLYADRFSRQPSNASNSRTISEGVVLSCNDVLMVVEQNGINAYTEATVQLKRFEGEEVYFDEPVTHETWWTLVDGTWVAYATQNGTRTL